MKEQKSREAAIGHKTNIQITKNKTAKPFLRASFMLMYGEGFDKYYDVATMAEYLGIIERGGAWYSYGENKWQGQAKLLEEMRQDKDLFEKIRGEVNQKIKGEDSKIEE